MKALLIDRHGPYADLRPREAPLPIVQAGEVRVEVQAAGVNPSDVGSAEGRFAHARLPRILGRDFAGRVVEGPPEWLGAEVFGSGGDLGITRDGTHAEQIVLPAAGVARRPKNLSAEQAAAVGVPFVTAWLALVELGRVAAGETVVVSGALGAVGSAAVEIAAARGARVIALVRSVDQARRIDRNKIAGVASVEGGDLERVTREVTGGKGAELALNGVGAAIFQPLIEALAAGGRLVVYSAAAGRQAPLDLFDLYRRRLFVAGVNTGALEAADGARILADLAPQFESGKLVPRQPVECFPLESAATAYARVAAGSPAKIVLLPSE